MEEFIKISQIVGKNIIYVQGAGGNSSIKIGKKLYIKSSGERMKDMSLYGGYVTCSLHPIVTFLKRKKKFRKKDEKVFIQLLEDNTIREESYGLPSMETGFHAIIPSTYVFHIHSVYANVFTCMKESETEIEKVCHDMDFTIIDYKNPGYELAYYVSKVQPLSSLIFLKNHGVIIHGDSTTLCLKLIKRLHLKMEEYLKKKKVFMPFKTSQRYVPIHTYSFPDSVVFANLQIKDVSGQKKKDVLEITSAQQYIVQTIKRLGKTPLFLSERSVKKLLEMKQEKHRLALLRRSI